MDRLKFHLTREPYNFGISVHIAQEHLNGLWEAQPMEFKEVQPGRLSSPCVQLSYEDAQVLIDELWLCGIRPSEGTGSAGSLAATEKHLADMRKIAFNKLSID